MATKINNEQLPDVIKNKTIDTSNDIDTTTTKLTITGGTNGQVLSTDGSGNLSWTTAGGLGAPIAIVRKTANESVVNSTTMQDDDHLTYTFPAGYGKHYLIIMYLVWFRGNISNSVSPKVGGSGNFFSGIMRRDNSNTLIRMNVTDELSAGAISLNLLSTVGPYPERLTVMWMADSVPTTFVFRWAQTAASTTALRAQKGSFMEIYDLGDA